VTEGQTDWKKSREERSCVEVGCVFGRRQGW